MAGNQTRILECSVLATYMTSPRHVCACGEEEEGRVGRTNPRFALPLRTLSRIVTTVTTAPLHHVRG